ncbi:MAG: N-acetyl-1-D-myo-inositol-2-amino-2-deoxy-alpha-D-glucopyranoside deacetylase [Candidatus Nanopelagicales bacterium]
MSHLSLLFVHAHPDDETISTGATMAKYVAAGARVTLVTCTSGEEGEILVPELAHLSSANEDKLGEHRQKELALAMQELKVNDHRFLGGAGKYRDSGMVGTEANSHPKSFMNADLLSAASDLVAVIREVKPHILITYDEFGGYGHPDHIQAHRVAHYAKDLAQVESFKPELGPAHKISQTYWTAIPLSLAEKGFAQIAMSEDSKFFGVESLDEINFLQPDQIITTEIDGKDFLEQKLSALKQHRTQVDLNGDFFKLMTALGPEAFGVEYFRRVDPPVKDLNGIIEKSFNE